MKRARSVCFVTGNANKLRELKSKLESSGAAVELTSQHVDLPELQGTPEEIATKKAGEAARLICGPVLVEDTCLQFHALKGLPGPYIKWFLDAVGCEGLVKLLAGFEDKNATALCTLAVCEGPGLPVTLLQGRTEGRVVAPRGPGTFGWDPVFEPTEGGGLTYAEMTAERKNTISHRARAVELLAAHLART